MGDYAFTLEYGADQHYEEVQVWLLNRGIMVDMMFEEEEED
jgi:hypothetical protein